MDANLIFRMENGVLSPLRSGTDLLDRGEFPRSAFIQVRRASEALTTILPDHPAVMALRMALLDIGPQEDRRKRLALPEARRLQPVVSRLKGVQQELQQLVAADPRYEEVMASVNGRPPPSAVDDSTS